ncbi:hypothetical protein [Burkholderia stagnalis]|nr:hypothetical protein [Burkholderia stagnalis]
MTEKPRNRGAFCFARTLEPDAVCSPLSARGCAAGSDKIKSAMMEMQQ